MTQPFQPGDPVQCPNGAYGIVESSKIIDGVWKTCVKIGDRLYAMNSDTLKPDLNND